MNKNEKFDPKKPLDSYCKNEIKKEVNHAINFDDFISGVVDYQLEVDTIKSSIKKIKGNHEFKYMDAETLENINAKWVLTLSIDRYQKEATRTIDTTLGSTNVVAEALLGLAAETGEVCSLYQKKMDGHPFNKDDLINEIGDVLWFTAELCTAMDISLEECAVKNLLKLLKRYPNGYSAEDSIARKDVIEKG